MLCNLLSKTVFSSLSKFPLGLFFCSVLYALSHSSIRCVFLRCYFPMGDFFLLAWLDVLHLSVTTVVFGEFILLGGHYTICHKIIIWHFSLGIILSIDLRQCFWKCWFCSSTSLPDASPLSRSSSISLAQSLSMHLASLFCVALAAQIVWKLIKCSW